MAGASARTRASGDSGSRDSSAREGPDGPGTAPPLDPYSGYHHHVAEGVSMLSATEIKRTARQAGLLYLAMSILAMIDYFYLQRLFFVEGDPGATARNILEREPLYRMSILVALVTQ